ncbi:hypothetical protein I3843_01G073600 [Carya illinoinensis]|nr:hypothetical protein I3843_01G073600 [Carya illinoinensis]
MWVLMMLGLFRGSTLFHLCLNILSLSKMGVSFHPMMALLQDKVFLFYLDSWFKLKDAILEGGIPFDRIHGTSAFEYSSLDPKFNHVFNTAMFNLTTKVTKTILMCYKGFEKLKQLVDVGGGLGITLNLITSKYPYIKGINFDLPHVIQHAPPYPAPRNVGTSEAPNTISLYFPPSLCPPNSTSVPNHSPRSPDPASSAKSPAFSPNLSPANPLHFPTDYRRW